MTKKYCIEHFLNSGLVFMIILMIFFSTIGVATPDKPDEEKFLLEIKEKLTGITDEEKEVLEKLFLLTQDIEEMDKMKLQIAIEIEKLNEEVTKLESLIASEALIYEENCKLIEEVLKAYQRSGPGSYIELILSSDNLTTLLRRINILNDITRDTTALLNSLQESKARLASDKNNIMEKLLLVEEQKKKLEETLEKNIMLKEDLEIYLASLEGEQEKYEEYLQNIELFWSQLKPLFSETMKTFSNMLLDDNLPSDAIKTEFSFFSIKGIIEEQTFKEIISKQSFPTEINFEFSSLKLEIAMPEKNLYLSGPLVIVEGKKLVLEVNEGRFFGMPLEKSSIEDLFSQGYVELNLGQILGKNKLKSIKINDDNIELQIIPSFFN